jgi:lipoprotein-releasing system permease protein
MALVIALSPVNDGFRKTLQKNLLGATAHVNLLQKETGEGISDWRNLAGRLARIRHVKAVAPVLYAEVFLTGPSRSKGAVLKGIHTRDELAISDTLRRLKRGSLASINDSSGLPGIVIGARLASDIRGSISIASSRRLRRRVRLRPSAPRLRGNASAWSGSLNPASMISTTTGPT